jgi:tetratricopeptide (TPR) repeat protein
MALHEEALALRRGLGDRHGIAASLNSLGSLANRQGDFGRAVALHEEALALARELGDQALCAMTLIYRGHTANRRGDAIAAATQYQEALRLCRDTGDRYLLPYALEAWAWVTRDQGDGERAAQLYGAAAALRAATHAVLAPHEVADREHKMGALRESLGTAAFERGWAAGQQMLPGEAVAQELQEASAQASLDETATSPASGLTAR